MKTCLSCNITYDDSKNFCKKCGSALVEEQKLESREAAKKQVLEDRLKADSLNKGLLLEYAQFLFGNNLYKDAVAVLLKILALDEKDVTATDLLFRAYQNLQMYKEAGETGKQLLAFRPGDISLHESLILIFAALKNNTETLGFCDYVLNTEPKNVVALYNKALILLEENDLPKACSLFKQAYLAGQKDQITVIYTGIHHALQGEFDQAVEVLLPCLDKEQDNSGNISIQRGMLYMAYSFCKTSADLSHVKQWFAKLDLALLKKNQLTQDENAVLVITRFVIDESLNNVSDSADIKYELNHLIKNYLGVDYFTAESSPVMADLWYKVGSKEAKLVSISDALLSFQQAVDLMPGEQKYSKALAEAKAELAIIRQKRKRKQVLIFATGIGIVALIIGSVFLYRFIKENNVWKAAVNENTSISYQRYLSRYPEGRFCLEASSKKEDLIWEKVKKSNNTQELYDYLLDFPNGKYYDEVNWKISKTINNVRGFISYLTNSDSKKYLSNAKEELNARDYLVNFSVGRQSYSKSSIEKIRIDEKETIITLTLHNGGGVLHGPNHNQAFTIKDKFSSSSFTIKSSNIDFEKLIPVGKRSIELHFEKLPEKIRYFDLVEGSCRDGCWNFYNIKIEAAEIEEKLNYQVGKQSRGLISIVNISNTVNNTIISIKKENPGGIIMPPGHSEAFYIQDDLTNKKYKIVGSSIGFNQSIVKNEVFDLIFEKIDNDTKQISLIEGDLPSNSGWHFTEIMITP